VQHVADLPGGGTGADVAALAGDLLAVSVPGSGQVLLFRPDGTLATTVSASPALVDPTGLAGDGDTLLVAAADPADRTAAVIVRVPAG
jgi:hypothetical protein